MSDQAIAAAVGRARAYLAEHPEEAVYTDSAATASLVDGLRFRVDGPGGLRIETDMPRGIGGAEAAPSPGWLMRAAHASCVASLIAIRAAEMGVRLSRLEVTVDSESDDRGILGMAPDAPVGPAHTHVRVVAAGDAPDDQIDEIASWGIAHCPVNDAVQRAIPVTADVTIEAP
jgi:uncharacterized OsmC-like protein